MTFQGKTFDKTADGPRLTRQLDKVFHLMHDGCWRTLAAVNMVVPGTETAISARLRDIRKSKYPGWTMESRRLKGGQWIYRVLPIRTGQLKLWEAKP